MSCPYCQNTIPHNGKGCPRRKRSGAHRPRRIYAYDCETVEGKIVLWLRSDAGRHAEYLYDPAGLTAETILEWTIEHSGRNDLHIGFFFDYDTNQLVRHLPAQHLEQLRARGSVVWRRWVIRHVPNKRTYIRDRQTGRSVTIWDVAGFVQCSFYKLICDWSLGSVEEREYIASMKACRADLSQVAETDLVRYTTLECALLAEWFQKNLDIHEAAGIRLRSYSGAGSTAAALMARHGWRPPEVPAPVQRAAEKAYFGGRSETSLIGPAAGPIYGYDINSAYPSAIAELPELAGARWFHVKRWSPGSWGFWRVRWSLPAASVWGPFPVRGARLPGPGRRSLSLLYPITGSGWYHTHEVAAAMEAYPGCVEALEGWIIEPRGRPFHWVEETAEMRLAWKQAGDPRAYVLKVGLNSLYGKMAQHTGQHPLQSMAYAAAVTSRTRARLFALQARHGHDILLVATDGILSRVPLDVEIGSRLGQWEMATYENAWILQAGVYWCGEKIRTRGIDGRTLTLEAVQAAWREKRTRARLSVETRRVLSYRIACARGRPELTGTWETSSRIVSFSPAPRRREWFYDNDGALLTLPARVEDYRAQQALDEIIFCLEPGEWEYDSLEALPRWSMPE